MKSRWSWEESSLVYGKCILKASCIETWNLKIFFFVKTPIGIVWLLILDWHSFQKNLSICSFDVEPQVMWPLRSSISKIWQQNTTQSAIFSLLGLSSIYCLLARVPSLAKPITKFSSKIVWDSYLWTDNFLKKSIRKPLICYKKCLRKPQKIESALRMLSSIRTSPNINFKSAKKKFHKMKNLNSKKEEKAIALNVIPLSSHQQTQKENFKRASRKTAAWNSGWESKMCWQATPKQWTTCQET